MMSFFRNLFGSSENNRPNNNPKRNRPYKYSFSIINVKHTGKTRRYARTVPNGSIARGTEIDFMGYNKIFPLSFRDIDDDMGQNNDDITIVLVKKFFPDGDEMGAIPCLLLNKSTNKYTFMYTSLKECSILGINHAKHGWDISVDGIDDLKQEIIWIIKEQENYDLN